MRRIVGTGFIGLGLVCLLISLGFVVYNRYEASQGEKASQALLQDVQTNMMEEKLPEQTQPLPEAALRQMQTVPVGDYESIGVLSIPVLELELPVLTQWNYVKLKDAPCLYYGSYYAPDFVIAAHNYPSHFGRLSQLQPGDLVTFTDVTGVVRCYQVVLLETLPPTATEEMITSGFDLSLYTCTTGGGSRVTVRCSAISAMGS